MAQPIIQAAAFGAACACCALLDTHIQPVRRLTQSAQGLRSSMDADALWITEAWVDQASHVASLSLSAVEHAISIGRPLISGFGERFETIPMGGHGLVASAGT